MQMVVVMTNTDGCSYHIHAIGLRSCEPNHKLLGLEMRVLLVVLVTVLLVLLLQPLFVICPLIAKKDLRREYLNHPVCCLQLKLSDFYGRFLACNYYPHALLLSLLA